MSETALELIILSQLTIEAIEDLPKEINRQRIKSHSSQLVKLLEPIAEKYYNKIFFDDEEVTQNICYEYLQMVKVISTLNLPSKVSLSQILQAWQLNSEKIENTAHDIIKARS